MSFTAGSSPKKVTFVPDYLLSDEEVLCQVALQRMQSGRAFTILAYAGALRSQDGIRTPFILGTGFQTIETLTYDVKRAKC
jgi:hypothetical protein